MKRVVLLLTLFLSTGCQNTAERLPGTPSSPVRKVTDPVCGRTIDTTTPRILEYRNGSYYFCSQECVTKFRTAPDPYVVKK
jgi:Cu+-exporting ATPase